MTEEKKNANTSESTPQKQNPGEGEEADESMSTEPGKLFDIKPGGDGTGKADSPPTTSAETEVSTKATPAGGEAAVVPGAEESAPQQTPKDESRGIFPEIRSWLRDLVIAALICLVLIVYVAQPFRVEKTSMVPLLENNDRILVSKISLWFEPIRRGEIVVLLNPRNTDESWIKRVIGLPGETVQIVDGIVYINGKALPESYISDDERNSEKNHYPVLGSSSNRRILEQLFNRYSADIGDFLEKFGLVFLEDWETDSGEPIAVRIPEGYYFVCGDNRSNSLDSRDSVYIENGGGPGFIPAKYIYGKAIFRYWPLDKIGPIEWGIYPDFEDPSN